MKLPSINFWFWFVISMAACFFGVFLGFETVIADVIVLVVGLGIGLAIGFAIRAARGDFRQ